MLENYSAGDIGGCVCEGGPGRPCARGLQAPVFAALARERARLPGVKYDAAAWPWRNAARVRFWRARLRAALAGDFGRRRGGGWWRLASQPGCLFNDKHSLA